MPAAPSLHELQHRFMAALYAPDQPGPVDAIAGNGLEPAARMRIYRRSCHEIQAGALRTTYPAVLALGGDAWFDQTVRKYRRAHPSASGNLQDFGAGFAAHLDTLPECRRFPYLPDVARLEWLRQQTTLAAASRTITVEEGAACLQAADGAPHIVLHPSVHLLDSRHAVLTIWRYATQPTSDRLVLGGEGESVVLWREEGEVAMGVLDDASFAFVSALARGYSLDDAHAVAVSVDSRFDLSSCMQSMLENGLVAGIRSMVVACGA